MNGFYDNANLTFKFQAPLLIATFLILTAGGFLLQAQVKSAMSDQTKLALSSLKAEQQIGEQVQRATLESKADVVGQFMVESSPNFILSYDLMTLDKLQEVVTADAEVAFALFLKSDGSSMTTTEAPPEAADIIRKTYPIIYDGVELGQVLVGMSQAQINERIKDSDARVEAAVTEVRDSGEATVRKVIATMAASYVAVLAVITILVSLLFRKAVVLPLHRIVALIGEMGKGHLDQRLRMNRRDEIGQIATAMDDMAEKLGAMVHRINAVSAELHYASQDISEASKKVDQSARSQVSGVEDTSAAVVEISASIDRVGQGVGVLASSAAESTSSVLEMSASIEEVAGSTESLSRIVEEVGSSITEVAVSIRQVAENSDILKESSEITASSVAQMDVSVIQVQQNVKETAVITEAVRVDAEGGRSSVEATINGIQEIRRSSQITTEAIQTLSEKARNIGAILAMIDEVTDQTALLALNAAIIAAQAGEHGKGFTVVAEEMRALADRASSSTREIADIIRDVQQETDKVVQATRLAEQSISAGEQLSSQSGAALAKVVNGIKEVDQRMEQIAKATLEQASGSRMIRSAMEKVSQMIGQTAAATREQSSVAGTIMNAVERMKELTSHVKTSTREQSNGSKVIASAMEEINQMVQKINMACEEQTQESEQIKRAVKEIHGSTDANLSSTQILKEAVLRQNQQITLLQQEMGAFRVGTA